MTSHLPRPSGPSRSSRSPVAADGPRLPASALWRGTFRAARAVLLTTVAGIALLGAAVTPWAGMLVVAPGLGVVLAVVVALVDPSARRGMQYAVAAGIVLVPFANGLVLLGSAGGGILLALLLVGPVVGLEWSASREESPPAIDVARAREVLSGLPTALLLDEWRASEELLRSPADRASAAGIRGLLLDELSHRDPGGVARWLEAGGSAPDAYIEADRGGTR